MKRLVAVAIGASLVLSVLAGQARAEDWTKATIKGTLAKAEAKIKDKGEVKLERINGTGMKEDGTFDLTQPGSTLQFQFKAGGKSWSVSFTGIGTPEPYSGVTESPVAGENLPPGLAAKCKDGAELAKAAKAAGVGFPATISIYAPQPGKVWAVVTDANGNNVILDPTTAEKAM
ncbi:MAG: hypothetical protein KatS3mg102_1871 [Planctomycetota bacterium]|nr:MAG: hypothetical protein KatS3mg102_1871 [Planctomycetota bacterium]